LLVFVTGAIASEAVHRFLHPSPVGGWTVVWVAALGILVNGGTAMLFFRGRDSDLNVRGAFISEPALRQAGKEERYVVCVRSDSRNANRNYTGSKDRIGYFYAGHLNQLIDATKEQCGNAAYKPFPELEKLCQAKKCV